MIIKRGPVSKIQISFISIAFLLNAYFLPRLLVSMWGKADPWTNYLYMYGIGGAFFLIGLFVIIKSGSYTPGRGREDFWFKILLAGFVFFASLHATWIYFALTIPVLKGV